MEAIIDKKSPKKRAARWQPRLFRLKDRRLIHFKKGVQDPTKAMDSSAKYTLDLTYLTALTIDPKHENVLTIMHPVIDLSLRFKNNDTFVCWLKVLSSACKSINGDGPKIKTSIPSNYSHAIWHVLQALYSHPHLQTTEGIFRKSGDKNEQIALFHDLVEQTYDTDKLTNYKNIHVLAKVLCALLSNLPSTIFKEKQIDVLIQFFDRTRVQLDKNKKQRHMDADVASISKEHISKLKLSMETLYFNKKDKHYYGLMTLIFHLLKQVIVNEKYTKQTAESLSTVFAEIFESKIFLMKVNDPMQMQRAKYLVKALTYWAYDIFPEQQWRIGDIVIVDKCESDYMDEYNTYFKKKAPKHKQSKSGQWRDKYLLSKKQVSKKQLDLDEKKDDNTTKIIIHDIPKDDMSSEEESVTATATHQRRSTMDDTPNEKTKAETTHKKTNTFTRLLRTLSVGSATDMKVDDIDQQENETPDSDVKEEKTIPTTTKIYNKIDEKRRDSLKLLIQQRASYQEINSRGILLDSQQTQQREQHKRHASLTIDKLLSNRPTPNDLHSQNIIDTKAALFYGAAQNEIYCDNIDKETFANKLQQRLSKKEMNSKGILLDSKQSEQRKLHKRNASGTVDKLLMNRPTADEMNERGILLDSKQSEQKKLHKRNASDTVDRLLMNRPTPNDLHSKHIINTEAALHYGASEHEIYTDNMDKEQFASKLKQRPTREQVNEIGILLDSEQAEQKKLHKRNASDTVGKLLMNRPTPNDLHSKHIINTQAALDYGASEHEIYCDNMDKQQFVNKLKQRPSWQELNESGILLDSTQTERKKQHKRNASIKIDKLLNNRPTPDDLYTQNIMKRIWEANAVDLKKLEMKLKQRPSIAETVERGILLYRTDGNINYDLQKRCKELHRRKASQNIEKFMLKRPTKNELKEKSILMTNKGFEKKRKHKRQTSRDLEAGLKNRTPFQQMKYIHNSKNDSTYTDMDPTLNIYRDIVKLFTMMYNVKRPFIET